MIASQLDMKKDSVWKIITKCFGHAESLHKNGAKAAECQSEDLAAYALPSKWEEKRVVVGKIEAPSQQCICLQRTKHPVVPRWKEHHFTGTTTQFTWFNLMTPTLQLKRAAMTELRGIKYHFLKSLVWHNLGLNPSLPDHWWTLYPLGQGAGINLHIYYIKKQSSLPVSDQIRWYFKIITT